MLSWKSLSMWALSALMFTPSQGSIEGGGEGDGGYINGANKCIAVDYNGTAVDTRIVSVYKEYSDCTLDEGGSFSASDYSSDYSRCFRDKSGASNRIWNTGCGWEIGYRNSDNIWVAVARSNSITGEVVDCSTSGWEDLTLWTWYDSSSGAFVNFLHSGYGQCYKFPRPDKSTTAGPGTTGGEGGPGTTGGEGGPGTTGGEGGPGTTGGEGGPGTTGGEGGPGTTGGGGPGTTGGEGGPPSTSGGGPGPSGGTGQPPATSGGGPGPSGGTGEPPATSGGGPGPSGGTGQPPVTSGGGPGPSGGTGQPPATTTGSGVTTTSGETTTSAPTTTAGPTIYTTVTEWQINVTIVTSNGDLLNQCADGDSSVVGPIVETSLSTVLTESAIDYTLQSVSASFENCEDTGGVGDDRTLVWMFKVTVTTTVSVDAGTTFDQTAFSNSLQSDISGSMFTDELNSNLQIIYSDGDTVVTGAGVSMDSISVQSPDTNNGQAAKSKGDGNKELYLLIGIIVAVVIAAIAIIYGIVRYHNRRKADGVILSDDQAGRVASLSADRADPFAVAVVGGTATTGSYGESNQQNYNQPVVTYAQPLVTDAPGKFLVMGDAIVPPAPALPGSYANNYNNNTETTPQNQSGEQESDEESVQQEAVTVD